MTDQPAWLWSDVAVAIIFVGVVAALALGAI